tara:strand:- start:15225 stop:16133 length:909 start_codon:yes stop_codon:yes gene_type:complete
MIHVTQGHERGVGLEIFLKSFICLKKSHQQHFTLYCNKSTLEECLTLSNLPFQIDRDHVVILSNKLKVNFVGALLSQTTDSLNTALERMENNDILLTLPSSKDQIVCNNRVYRGYTDYLRHMFPEQAVIMSFVAPHFNVALLTDHIALKDIESNLTPSNFKQRVQASIDHFLKIKQIEEVFIAGLNPHCGEDGIISGYDSKLQDVVIEIEQAYPGLKIRGLIPGDTILFNAQKDTTLFIFPFHDQALAPFKRLNGLTGINLTLGLPFRRVSVDHGTAFDLYGKNKASYQGMIYLLEEVISWK